MMKDTCCATGHFPHVLLAFGHGHLCELLAKSLHELNVREKNGSLTHSAQRQCKLKNSTAQPAQGPPLNWCRSEKMTSHYPTLKAWRRFLYLTQAIALEKKAAILPAKF
jgi:hypothetical protein